MSAADVAMVSAIKSSVSSNVREAIDSRNFATVLSSNVLQTSGVDPSVVSCLVAWGVVEEADASVAVGASNGNQGTEDFYPDWVHHSGTCLQDGNEPSYMKVSKIWLLDSLEACCSRFFSGWNFNKCMNSKGSGLWYVDHTSDKCVTDCEEGNGKMCGGLANTFSDNLYSDPRSCCESELSYRFIDFCEVKEVFSSQFLVCFCVIIQIYSISEYMDGAR